MPRLPKSLNCSLAGQAYPADAAGIVQMVRSHFDEAGIPLPASLVSRATHCPGIVVPHLDFRVGGSVYPHGYQGYLTDPVPETVVILGVGHRCPADISIYGAAYQTPLGTLGVDGELIAELLSHSGEKFAGERIHHKGEHSIEFAAVYLRALASLYPEWANVKIVPLLCGGMQGEIAAGEPGVNPYDECADLLRAAVQRLGRRVSLLVSVDGSHVGPRFGHPFAADSRVLQNIAALDEAAWSAVEAGDPDDFFRAFLPTRNAQYFDGVGALRVALRFFAKEARFVIGKYAQWHESSDQSVVTLAGGIFENHQTKT